MNGKIIRLLLGISSLMPAHLSAQVLFENGRSTEIYLGSGKKEVVHTALDILSKDVKNVFNASLILTDTIGDDVEIIAGTAENIQIKEYLKEHGVEETLTQEQWETFHIRKIGKKQILILGSDARGLAYGLLEISRMIGVSPWEWWADVHPDKRNRYLIAEIDEKEEAPDVKYRGIFLNDEDWGLTPWSTKNFEPNARTKYPVEGRFKGQVGPKTYEKVFELLLRLRANTVWPAMHEVTMPFYFVEGNREMAERYGMVVSTSHCEPMMRNSATEWDLEGNGVYNFIVNKQAVVDYWADRLKELSRSENIFTVGMRGKHDGRMLGVRNTDEYKKALDGVLQVQDSLLRKYISADTKAVPRQFVPYKEVLDVYRAGLQVDENITLVWPDDNFGYIRHFPDEAEKKRAGGNGVYYHTSYWGEPHDFLWLGIVQPSLMYQQMKMAYDRQMRTVWILNVGDIKPSEYLTELFLDMAWDTGLGRGESEVNRIVTDHLADWLQRTFGEKAGRRLLPIMKDFYLLSHIRKPEFMGNTRTYDRRYKQIADLPWSNEQIDDRLRRFHRLSDEVEQICTDVPGNRRAAYFEMIQYPVQASNEMNKKILYAQMARHNKADSTVLWMQSDMAYDSIAALTKRYNGLLDGKWNYMMDFRPRDLPVFGKVKRVAVEEQQISPTVYLKEWNGTEYSSFSGVYKIIDGLGYEGKALCMKKNSIAEYRFRISRTDSVTIDVHLLPTHAVENGKLRFQIELDGCKAQIFDIETAEYSEEWKANILRAQSVKTVKFPFGRRKGCIRITAIDEGLVIDQIKLR